MFQEESKWLKSTYCYSHSLPFAQLALLPLVNRIEPIMFGLPFFHLWYAVVDYHYAVMLVWHLPDAKKRWRA